MKLWSSLLILTFGAVCSAASAHAVSCESAIQKVTDRAPRDLGSDHGAIWIEDVHRGPLLKTTWGKSTTTQSRFLVGSVSKTLTGLIGLRLIQKSELSLNQTIASSLPKNFEGSAWKSIQLHHLLSHTSGIPDYLDSLDIDYFLWEPRSFSQVMAAMGTKLNFQSGTALAYSNTNYYLAARLLEKKTKTPFSVLFENELIRPIGLTETGLAKKGGSYFGGTSIDFSNLVGAGSAYSSAEDLIDVLRAIDREDYLQKSSRRRLFTPNPSCHGAACDRYGIGFSLRYKDRIRNQPWFLHEGHLKSVSAIVAKIPTQGVNVVVLTDRGGINLERYTRGVLERLSDAGCFR